MKNVTLSGNITLGEERDGWCISKRRGVESKGHRLDMTDNTQNSKQCDGEVELTSSGIMTLTSQLGLALVPHTFSFMSTAGEKTGDCAASRQSQQNNDICVMDTFG